MRGAHKTFGLLAAAFLLVGPAIAEAASIGLRLTGTIDETYIGGLSEGLVAVGTPFSLSVTFDDAVSDEEPDPSMGRYPGSPPPWSIVLEVGGYTLSTESSYYFRVHNNALDEVYDHVNVWTNSSTNSVVGPLSTPTPPEDNFLEFYLFDTDGAALQSDALTSVPWNLSFWPDSRVDFGFQDTFPTTWFFGGSGPIESLTVVPEPSAALLCGLGLAGLVARRRLRA
jgi:hypothetical protein